LRFLQKEGQENNCDEKQKNEKKNVFQVVITNGEQLLLVLRV